MSGMAAKATDAPRKAQRVVAVNRKARHEYYIEETCEAGLVLSGTEVKSARAGRVSLAEAFARIEGGEAWLFGMNIAPYEHGNRYNLPPNRKRKLLLHKRELASLIGKTQQQGLTLVPLQLYFKRGYAKLELGVARGKKLHDKREAIAQREAQREIARTLRGRGQ